MSEPFSLVFTDQASRSLARMERSVAVRIVSKLEWLAENAGLMRHTPLTGQWSGYYRLRVGDYRVIYGLDTENQLIVVEVVGHRREVYDE